MCYSFLKFFHLHFTWCRFNTLHSARQLRRYGVFPSKQGRRAKNWERGRDATLKYMKYDFKNHAYALQATGKSVPLLSLPTRLNHCKLRSNDVCLLQIWVEITHFTRSPLSTKEKGTWIEVSGASETSKIQFGGRKRKKYISGKQKAIAVL